MVSGIKSLAATHEQLVIGWTGPVSLTPATDANGDEGAEEETLASADDVTALEGELEAFDKREGDGRVKNVPVWLDKEIAKGHYEGYCKTSEWRASCGVHASRD
jgi:trehalose 6-phosphate synthase/phosphatase